MKKIFLLAAVCGALICNAQLFPTTNALRDYNNKWIGLSPIEGFSQKRLNTLLLGMINFIDSARNAASGGGSVDLTATNLSISRRPYVLTVAQLRTLASALVNDTTLFYIRDKGREGMFYFDATDASSPDDTAMTIVNGSKRVKRIFDGTLNPAWWGAKGDFSTNDAPAFNAMFRWMERQAFYGNYEVKVPGKYSIASPITLPGVLQSSGSYVTTFLKISGGGTFYASQPNMNMFYRQPSADAQVSAWNNNYKLVMEGMLIFTDMAGVTGLRVGPFYGAEFNKIHFVGLDTAVVGSFWTKSKIDNCFFTMNLKVDVKLQSYADIIGLQTVPGSASNTNRITNCRFYESPTSFTPIMLMGTDDATIEWAVIEGSQPRKGIYSDYQGSTVSNEMTIDHIWFEGNSGNPGVTFSLKNAGTTSISNVQRTYTDSLFDLSGSASGCSYILDRFVSLGIFPAKPFRLGASTPSFGGRNIKVLNSPDLYIAMSDASNYVDGAVPDNLAGDYFKGANAGYTISSTNSILLEPSFSLAEGIGIVKTRGNHVYYTDDVNFIGITPTGNLRPKAVYAGTTGYYLDNSGRIRWGKVGVTPDVSIAREAAGQLSILDNAGNYRDLKLRTITALTKLQAINSPTSATISDSALVTNRTTGDLEMSKLNFGQLIAGNTAARPTGVQGLQRFNTDSGTVEVHNGSGAWLELASRQFVRDNITSAAGNKFNALSLVDYSGVSDAAVPGSGTNATGTDNTAHIQDMINASASGQLIIIPDGNYRVSGALTNITTKKLNLFVIGNLYVDVGVNFIKIVPPGGAFVQHSIIFLGNAFGMVNIPTHSKANYDAGTGPDWSTMTGVLITLLNVQQVYIQLNKAEGFKAPVELQGSGGAGCQEITVAGRWFYKNANDILITSLDGSSYNDKNTFTGVSGGTLRVSGGCALKVDGYAPAAGNGENFNGATRSNEFHFLIEQADTIAICNSDMTFNTFDVTVENGTNSGIFSSAPWLLRTTFPNNVSGSKFIGRGIFTANQMGSGSSGTMGVNSTIEAMDIWSTGSTTRYGNHAEIDGNGTIVIQANGSLSKANRDAAPAYIKFVRAIEKEIRQDISSSTYTAVTGDRWIYYNHASGTLTLPAANIWVDKYITVYNEHGSAALTVTNVKSGYTTTIVAGGRATYHSNGIDWRD